MTKLFQPYWAALVQHLKTDPALGARCSEISEDPGAGWPKIWLEETDVEDWSTKTEDGVRPTLTLHIGSRYDGGKELRELCDLVHARLHDCELVLTEGQSVLCQFVGSTTVRDTTDNAKTRHTLMRFELLITEG